MIVDWLVLGVISPLVSGLILPKNEDTYPPTDIPGWDWFISVIQIDIQLSADGFSTTTFHCHEN